MNFEERSRSNYFKVKDLEAFKKAAANWPGVEVVVADDEVALVAEEGWPNYRYNEEKDDDEEFYLFNEVAPHLVDESVAVFMSSGHEGLRYVTGHATAFNNKGVRIDIDLLDIYQKARGLGSSVSQDH